MTEIRNTLLRHLQQIAIPRHPLLEPIGHLAVQSYLISSFQRFGTVTEQVFDGPGAQGRNLLLQLPGRSSQRAPILIGAHYDGVPGTPAADDNGTGVAVLLALAEALANTPSPRPVWLVGFDLEEWGMLGGKVLAQSLREQQQPIHLMLSLEMLGYCSPLQAYPISGMEWLYGKTGDYIALIGNLGCWAKLIVMSQAMRKFVSAKWLPVPNAGKVLPATRLSDHSPFWDLGYEAVMVTDTAFMRNPNYHKSSDVIASLDFDFLVGVYRGLESAIRKL